MTARPAPTVFFESFTPGEVRELGSLTVSREEIVDFAREFDPQPFHLDEAAARRSLFGGLSASGWHSLGLLMRLLVDGLLKDADSMGSPGVDEVRWLKPVRPGDRLSLRLTTVACVPSQSKPDRGVIHLVYELYNQSGEAVVRMKGMNMLKRRPAA
ncbi:MAG: MaoC family dehydratase [Alphaproteobacteria bacterium]|nr:MaoC family dehydratase [Alphaproteobacteria bacterium]